MWRRKAEPNGDSLRALVEAQEAQVEIKSRREDVKEVSNAFRKIRRKNGFSDQLHTIIVGRP